MIFTPALLVILALSFTSADQVDNIIKVISQGVTKDMADAAKAALSGHSVNLNMQLLETMMNSLKGMEAEIKQLDKLSKGSPDIAKRLATQIGVDLESALPSDSNSKNAPRVVGAFVLGVTQIATDVVKMVLTRY